MSKVEFTELALKVGRRWKAGPNTQEGVNAAKDDIRQMLKDAGYTSPKEFDKDMKKYVSGRARVIKLANIFRNETWG